MPETAVQEPDNRSRKRTLYFNIERIEAFEEIAGKTILVEKIDVKGNPYSETLTVPDDLTAATYIALDQFVDYVRERLPEEE